MTDIGRGTRTHSLSRSIGRSTAFGLLANIAQVTTRLVTVPLVIRHLGLDGYGMWNILMATVSYMRFGTVGVKSAFQKYVAEATSTGDFDQVNRLLSTGCAILLGFSIVALLPAALLARNIAHWVGTPPEYLDAASAAISLLAVTISITNVSSVFESIITGGHRIDLVRKFATALTVTEAVAIAIALHYGFGLVAMSIVMGASEITYGTCCYVAARRVLPEAQVAVRFVSRSVVAELIRFAGSYQLVSLFESAYLSLIPFALLRNTGASAAGIYAIVTRIASAAGMLQEAFLPSVLSGGAMIYASGSAERMQAFIKKAFKVTLAASLLPLSLIAVVGPSLTLLWTGQASPMFTTAFILVCASSVLQSLSLLCLALYRTTGHAVLDNVRQAIRLGLVCLVAGAASDLGFVGVLRSVAVIELIGLAFMLYALAHTFPAFRPLGLLPDAARSAAAIGLIVAVALVASWLPLPQFDNRLAEGVRLLLIGVVCMIVAYPSVQITGAITSAEKEALLGVVVGRRSPIGGAA